MAKSQRPDGWDTYKIANDVFDTIKKENPNAGWETLISAFVEAGADAMLALLREQACLSVEPSDFVINNLTGDHVLTKVKAKGVFVFIPDDVA